jgi:hypothetical protein
MRIKKLLVAHINMTIVVVVNSPRSLLVSKGPSPLEPTKKNPHVCQKKTLVFQQQQQQQLGRGFVALMYSH